MDRFKNADGKSVVLTMIKAIQENKAYLGEVDGLIGDGDHGMNMNKGFTICGERIADANIGFTQSLESLGNILMSEIGGSMGPIYGTIFTEMADAGKDSEYFDAPSFLKILNASLKGLWDIIDAQVGDKTLIDTLVPARDAFQKSIENGDSFAAALDNLKAAAEKGRDSTKDLIAKYGRSSRLGERSKGVLDAGAVSCCILLSAMADGIKELL